MQISFYLDAKSVSFQTSNSSWCCCCTVSTFIDSCQGSKRHSSLWVYFMYALEIFITSQFMAVFVKFLCIQHENLQKRITEGNCYKNDTERFRGATGHDFPHSFTWKYKTKLKLNIQLWIAAYKQFLRINSCAGSTLDARLRKAWWTI